MNSEDRRMKNEAWCRALMSLFILLFYSTSTIPICKIVQVYNSGSNPLTHVANSGKIKMSKGSSTSPKWVMRIIVKTASIAPGVAKSV